MKETTLWGHLRDELNRGGMKTQKISDRFTPGVSDTLGVWNGRGVAMELKELDGVRVLKAKFRPGQLDFLRDWEACGGFSLILATLGSRVLGFRWTSGTAIEKGLSPSELSDHAVLDILKGRDNTWRDIKKELARLASKP